ncbi:MAG: hypothetical protein NTU98_01780 [Bacteroidetes bacterium]|nr:hypothetical protein [Bacteroidota bacterium]
MPFFISLVLSFSAVAQTWEFNKQKEGIIMYTRKEAGKPLKAYKGVTDIHAPAEKVFAYIEDVNNTLWWDKNLSEIKVLLYEKNNRAQFYLVFGLPWPISDRDLCVESKVTIDEVTGINKITSTPVSGVIPERSDKIRIKEYHQTWIIRPAGKDLTHVELEGYVDPAGSIPDWITNMLIVDSPYKIISGIKLQLEKK